MRISLRGMMALGGLCLGLAAAERVLLPTDVEPVVRQGRTLVPVRAVSEAFAARVQWLPRQREVVVSHEGREVRLVVGARQARVDGQSVALEVPPSIEAGRAFVPLRFVAEQLGFPVRYEQRTHSVLLETPGDGVTRVLPLFTTRAGIVLLDPPAGAEVTSPVRVHGQANVFEGTVTIEVQGPGGEVLGRGLGTGAMGAYVPFTARVPFQVPAGVREGRILVYSPGGRAEDEVLYPVAVPVRFGAP